MHHVLVLPDVPDGGLSGSKKTKARMGKVTIKTDVGTRLAKSAPVEFLGLI